MVTGSNAVCRYAVLSAVAASAGQAGGWPEPDPTDWPAAGPRPQVAKGCPTA